MSRRSTVALGLLLASCGAGERVVGPGPTSIGPAHDSQSDDAEGDEETGGESTEDGDTSGSEDAGTTTADASSTSEGSVDDEPPIGQCDPLSPQACVEGYVCVYNDVFVCVNDAGGPYGGPGEVCEFLNVCDPGLFCSAGRDVSCPEGLENCCVSFCDLTVGANACAAGSCVPYFPDGSPAAWLDDLGHCTAV